jgi:hypothetical protein
MLPSANADAPTSLSNLLLSGLHRIGSERGRRRGESVGRLRHPPTRASTSLSSLLLLDLYCKGVAEIHLHPVGSCRPCAGAEQSNV